MTQHHIYLDVNLYSTTNKHRQLSYRFYPHFHPYVADLVRQLIERSVAGLQAMDTQYVENTKQLPNSSGRPVEVPDGTLKVLPNSTQVILPQGTEVTPAGGQKKKLAHNMPATLPDKTTITVGNKSLALPGDIALAGGTRLNSQFIPANATVVISKDTPVVFYDGTAAKLVNETSVTLQGGRPKPVLYEPIFTEERYKPNPEVVDQRYPAKELDFTSSGAYAVYNWELFFHVPLAVALHLNKNGRFDEAQRWFHYIFDPTDNSDGRTPERFWKVKPFQTTDVQLIEEILTNLSTGADTVLRQDTINSIQAWKDAPFRPHLVARYRHSAYMFKTVMAYMDNLIAWGDTLFRQDSRESINEATQLYVLAANLLGRRPQAVPAKGSVRPQTYASLKKDLNEFGNALIDLEANLPFDLAPHPNQPADASPLNSIYSIGKTLYFCVPPNDKLLGYWDTVADRLYKIHNSLNIQGIFRQLPLLEPPIDPALLARAAAAGLDIAAIVSGANQPLPLVRFQFLAQKAAEICQEVKSLGNNLLSAIEKEDNEALAILRAKHERIILGLAETIKYAQWQEAIKTCEGLEKSLANAAQRYTYYERLLGKQESDFRLPELEALETEGLEKMRFRSSEPEVGLRTIEVDLVSGADGITGGRKISSHELEELTKLTAAQGAQEAAVAMDTIAAVLNLIPAIGVDVKPIGLGAGIEIGGEDIAVLLSTLANVSRAIAGRNSYEANQAAKIGSYARREQDWALQSNLAAGEITQTFKQLRAAQIREAIAEKEWNNHKKQIRHSAEIEYFLSGELTGDEKPDPNWKKKYANQALYTWMKREVKGLYSQCFQFAFDVAKKAERALQHELGNPELSYLQFGYLSGKEGLLAGEKLHLDIKRMEMAYHDLNQREYELTKHVSLLQSNPLALLQLRATGYCTVFLPEELFDMDCPGHYFRRIKSVAMSIPCVTGPYTSINCTLTLLKSSIRKTSQLAATDYASAGMEDPRFSHYFGSLQSIVTSSGQNDSGLFETNLRDERYLPFEGSGVISEWQLALPADPSKGDPRQFDYDTIADVILHIRYTAREGGTLLRRGAIGNLTNLISEAQAAGSVRLFSIRHEFPTEWAKFKSLQIDANGTAPLMLDVKPEHYPFWSKERLGSTQKAEFVAEGGSSIIVSYRENNKENKVKLEARLGKLWRGTLADDKPLPPLTGKFTLLFSDNKSIEELWLAMTWGKGT